VEQIGRFPYSRALAAPDDALAAHRLALIEIGTPVRIAAPAGSGYRQHTSGILRRIYTYTGLN
jgi:hypothetical protein